MESESVEFHRLQFRPPFLSTLPPLTAVINFFPGDKVDPSSRSHYADREGPGPTVDDNKYKTLIILCITPVQFAHAPFPLFETGRAFISRRSIFLFCFFFFFFVFFFLMQRIAGPWIREVFRLR